MSRPQAPAPPVGYRPHMPLKVKLEAALLALGLDPADVDWDHDPALQRRRWNPETGDTDPPANDPRFIVPRPRGPHRLEKSPVDTREVAKTRRLTESEAAFRRRLLARDAGEPLPEGKRKRKIPSRPFQTKRQKR